MPRLPCCNLSSFTVSQRWTWTLKRGHGVVGRRDRGQARERKPSAASTRQPSGEGSPPGPGGQRAALRKRLGLWSDGWAARAAARVVLTMPVRERAKLRRADFRAAECRRRAAVGGEDGMLALRLRRPQQRLDTHERRRRRLPHLVGCAQPLTRARHLLERRRRRQRARRVHLLAASAAAGARRVGGRHRGGRVHGHCIMLSAPPGGEHCCGMVQE